MSDEKHTCCKRVFTSSFSGHLCGKSAKFERDGKWYCGTHDPVRVKEKAEARMKAWREKWDAEKAAHDKSRKEQAEQKRRADMYDELLAALQDIARLPEGDEESAQAVARAAILKATGGQP